MYYMFLADGFEETEALVTLDLLRRAAIEVKTVGIGNISVLGTHGIRVFADIEECDFDISDCKGIILPGGMPGTENLYSSDVVSEAVAYCCDKKLLVCAICAAPIILGRKGLLSGCKAVCFPGFEEELQGAVITDASCVKCENIITAKGAGCVFEFSFEIISYIKNAQVASEIISVIQHKGL